MPISRRGRPGLLGLAARTAVVAGTASAVSGSMAVKQQGQAQAARDQAQFQAAQQQAQVDAAVQSAMAAAASAPPAVPPAAASAAAAPAAVAAPASPAVDLVGQLQQLAALKDQGILSQDEFDAAKAKLLA